MRHCRGWGGKCTRALLAACTSNCALDLRRSPSQSRISQPAVYCSSTSTTIYLITHLTRRLYRGLNCFIRSSEHFFGLSSLQHHFFGLSSLQHHCCAHQESSVLALPSLQARSMCSERSVTALVAPSATQLLEGHVASSNISLALSRYLRQASYPGTDLWTASRGHILTFQAGVAR